MEVGLVTAWFKKMFWVGIALFFLLANTLRGDFFFFYNSFFCEVLKLVRFSYTRAWLSWLAGWLHVAVCKESKGPPLPLPNLEETRLSPSFAIWTPMMSESGWGDIMVTTSICYMVSVWLVMRVLLQSLKWTFKALQLLALLPCHNLTMLLDCNVLLLNPHGRIFFSST